MKLRPATLDDIGFLTDVVVLATRDQGREPPGFDEPAFRAGCAEQASAEVTGQVPYSTTSVIQVDGRDVGRLRVVRSPHLIELCGIQLLPQAQSRGVGSRIVADLMAEARQAGVPFELSVERNNPRAWALYENLGMQVVGGTGTEVRLRAPQLDQD